MRLVFNAKWFWKMAEELTDAAIHTAPPTRPLTWATWADWTEFLAKETDVHFEDPLTPFHVAQYLWGDAAIFEMNLGKTVLIVNCAEVTRG